MGLAGASAAISRLRSPLFPEDPFLILNLVHTAEPQLSLANRHCYRLLCYEVLFDFEDTTNNYHMPGMSYRNLIYSDLLIALPTA